MGGKKGTLGLPESSNERLKPFIFHFFLSLSLETSGRILNKKKKKKNVEREKGRKLSINRKSNFCWCAPGCSEVPGRANRLSLQDPPQPIRDRSAAVRPADTRALIGALFSDTRLMTERRAGRSACSHTYSSCTHFLHVHTLTSQPGTLILHRFIMRKHLYFSSFLIQPVQNYPPLMWEDVSSIREPINRAG